MSPKTGLGSLLEKRKDYRNLLVVQALFISAVLFVQETLALLQWPFAGKVADSLVLTLGGIYLYILFDMLGNYTNSPVRKRIMLAVLITTYANAILFANPFFTILEGNALRTWLFGVHAGLFYVELTMLYYCIIDIFRDTTDTTNRLYGAACIYLMIGISFGSLYDVVNLAFPSSLGLAYGYGLPGYIRCLHYSFSVLSGLDTPYPDAIELVKNIGILESIYSNLYVVLVVGRLLSPSE